MSTPRAASDLRHLLLGCAAIGLLCCPLLGCGSRDAPPDPEAKVRLEKLVRLYKVYVEKNQKGPPDEQALREFGRQLSAEERSQYLIGDDVDNIFTSPRDNRPYEVRYGLRLDVSGPTQAVAWEATGKDGMRFVALSTTYVEEYDDETSAEYKQ